MKKILISFMTMLFMATSIMAQNTTVSGVLVDKSLGEGEPFATIRVFKQNTKEMPVAMFLTDENGRF
ncbi:MAG: hypothetical protein II597_08645, partial [Prevotella sp.]|nr:hypothetical protein [Prevotella sp.]